MILFRSIFKIDSKFPCEVHSWHLQGRMKKHYFLCKFPLVAWKIFADGSPLKMSEVIAKSYSNIFKE